MNTLNPTASVLLVEDSVDDAHYFRRELQRSGNGARMNHVSDGDEAIEFMKSSSRDGQINFPKVIFLELNTPRLNGFEVLTWIKNQAFSEPLKVVVLSASREAKDIEKAALLGATGYLVKPVTAKDITRLLDITNIIDSEDLLSDDHFARAT